MQILENAQSVVPTNFQVMTNERGFARTIATRGRGADEDFNLDSMAFVRSEVNCCNRCLIVS